MSGRVLRILLPLAAVVFVLMDGQPVAARLGPKSALVTVVAEGGTPIRDLKAKDFIVKEDGTKRDVVDAQLATEVLSAALLIDAAQPPRGSAPRDLRAAAATFVKSIQAVNPDARIALWQFARAPARSVDFTSKRDALETAIAKL